MIPRISYIAGAAVAFAGSSLAASPFGTANALAAFSSISSVQSAAAQATLAAQSNSTSNNLLVQTNSSSTNSASNPGITAAIVGISLPNAKNSSTKTITAKPQTTLALFNACSGSNSTCNSLTDVTYYGSVVTVSNAQTVLAVGCSQSGKNASQECFSKPLTITQGSSMFARVDDSGSVPTTVSCAIQGKTQSAVCTQNFNAAATATGSSTASATANVAVNAGNSSTSQSTFNFGGAQIHYNSIVITQGVEKLSASNTPSAPSSSIGNPSATSKASGAGSLTAPIASVAGVVALIFTLVAY